MQHYHLNDFKKHSVISVFKSTPPKQSGVECDIIIKTVNAHLTVRKYSRLTNEITDYKIVALECATDHLLHIINAISFSRTHSINDWYLFQYQGDISFSL
jgi:hypothetical protein